MNISAIVSLTNVFNYYFLCCFNGTLSTILMFNYFTLYSFKLEKNIYRDLQVSLRPVKRLFIHDDANKSVTTHIYSVQIVLDGVNVPVKMPP